MIIIVIQVEEGFLVLGFVPRQGRYVVEVGKILHSERQVQAHFLADGLFGLQVAALPHHHTGGV